MFVNITSRTKSLKDTRMDYTLVVISNKGIKESRRGISDSGSRVNKVNGIKQIEKISKFKSMRVVSVQNVDVEVTS